MLGFVRLGVLLISQPILLFHQPPQSLVHETHLINGIVRIWWGDLYSRLIPHFIRKRFLVLSGIFFTRRDNFLLSRASARSRRNKSMSETISEWRVVVTKSVRPASGRLLPLHILFWFDLVAALESSAQLALSGLQFSNLVRNCLGLSDLDLVDEASTLIAGSSFVEVGELLADIVDFLFNCPSLISVLELRLYFNFQSLPLLLLHHL